MKARSWCRAHYLRWYKTGDPLGVRPARWEGHIKPTCSVPSCLNLAHAHSLCASHVKRAERHGDPMGGRRQEATGGLADRLRVLVDVGGPDECWRWNAATLSTGYGQITFEGRRMYAHRAAWETVNGPVPDGLVVDHRCHNEDLDCPGGRDCRHRRCCNPAHLEPVTSEENMRRARERSNS